MTKEEFLEALKKTRREWRFIGLKIRLPDTHADGHQCPITAVAKCPGMDLPNAIPIVKLEGTLVRDILRASDRESVYRNEYDHELRKQLLEACGLEEI